MARGGQNRGRAGEQKAKRDASELKSTVEEKQRETEPPDILEQHRYGPGGAAGGGGVAGGAPNFPASYFAHDPYEEKLRSYLEAQNRFAVGNQGPFERKEIPDELIQLIQQKRQQQQLYEFENWLYNQFDFRDPNVVKYINEIYPDFIERRMQQVDADAELQKRYAKMRLQGGPRSREDLALKFAVDSGLIDRQTLNRPLVFPDEGAAAAAWPARVVQIQRGYYNPVTRGAGQHPMGEFQGDILQPTGLGQQWGNIAYNTFSQSRALPTSQGQARQAGAGTIAGGLGLQP